MIDVMVNILAPCARLLVSSVLYKKKHAAPQFHYYNFPQGMQFEYFKTNRNKPKQNKQAETNKTKQNNV